MLPIKEVLKILQSYNINSQKYGPTIYQKDNQIGICLEFKDPTFGFLTRAFLFNTLEEIKEFLKGYFWYKNNANHLSITLSLDNYASPHPKINYIFQDKIITINEMIHLEENIAIKNKQNLEEQEKKIYTTNIIELSNYLIEFLNLKENIKIEKNRLKTLENDLKFELLENLGTYYGKQKNFTKKPVSLEIITGNNEIENIKNSINNLDHLSEEELKERLNSLISRIKEEELDEKNLINIYSNSVYNYNIAILKKQIEFVKNKIEAEKNFNLKGSKIHNIDEELKSFLKTNIAPVKIEQFLQENKERINNKFNMIPSNLEAYSIISGKKINLPTIKEGNNLIANIDPIKDLAQKFDALSDLEKAYLVLYNSFYKNVCNFIINENYPDIETIKNNFNFSELYNEMEEIVFNENNIHYLNYYFKYLNFKDLNSYINSLIEISKTIENISWNIIGSIKVFYIEDNNTYKSVTINPIYSSKDNISIITLKDVNVLYIPDKIELDEEIKEFSIMTSENIYIKNKIEKTKDSLTVNKYMKKQRKDDDNKIIITEDLILKKEMIFNIGKLSDNYE